MRYQAVKRCRVILLPSERNQSDRPQYCINATIRHSRKGRTINTVKRKVVVRVGGRVRDEQTEHKGILGQ